MSGVLALVREVMGLYSSDQNATAAKKRFWACVRIAFIVSAAMALIGEHGRVISLTKEVAEQRRVNEETQQNKVMLQLAERPNISFVTADYLLPAPNSLLVIAEFKNTGRGPTVDVHVKADAYVSPAE